MNNSQMEELGISCDIMAEQQYRAEEQHLAGSALKVKPQVQSLIIHTVVSLK